MRSQKGITLSSVIIYIIAMSIVVGSIATLTRYFYGNIDTMTDRTDATEQHTEFNSYLTKEVNTNGNSVLVNLIDTQNKNIIAFSSGNQFKFTDNAIYFNKIQLCSNVTSCTFDYDETNNKITVEMQIKGKKFKNEYTLQNNV